MGDDFFAPREAVRLLRPERGAKHAGVGGIGRVQVRVSPIHPQGEVLSDARRIVALRLVQLFRLRGREFAFLGACGRSEGQRASERGGEDQVLRVLRGLVREGRLVRLGYCVYGRAIQSRLSGEPILYSANGFIGAARQALTKLGVQWEPTEAERAYNEGRSTQVPVNPVVRVKGRFSRQLRYGNTELVFER